MGSNIRSHCTTWTVSACWASTMLTGQAPRQSTTIGIGFGAQTNFGLMHSRDTDQLLVDFFDAIERACDQEAVPFVIIEEDVELEDGDEAADTD